MIRRKSCRSTDRSERERWIGCEVNVNLIMQRFGFYSAHSTLRKVSPTLSTIIKKRIVIKVSFMCALKCVQTGSENFKFLANLCMMLVGGLRPLGNNLLGGMERHKHEVRAIKIDKSAALRSLFSAIKSINLIVRHAAGMNSWRLLCVFILSRFHFSGVIYDKHRH